MSGRGGKYVRKAPSLTKKQLFLLLLNVVLALLALACAWGLNAVKSALLTQSAAKAWRGSSEMRFAQVSVFLPEDEKTDVNSIESFRRTLDQALVDASLEAPEGGSLYTDAYSGTATVSVVSGKTSLSVKTIGVGGDFFLFHPLTLRSGSYLSGSDYMPDRVLLDEELAWALFGSYDVAGMSIQIGERTYPVAGVVHREDDFASKEAYQDGPGMFMSYEALNAISETKLGCYEIVMPDMISGYAESVVKDKFPVGHGGGEHRALQLREPLEHFPQLRQALDEHAGHHLSLLGECGPADGGLRGAAACAFDPVCDLPGRVCRDLGRADGQGAGHEGRRSRRTQDRGKDRGGEGKALRRRRNIGDLEASTDKTHRKCPAFAVLCFSKRILCHGASSASGGRWSSSGASAASAAQETKWPRSSSVCRRHVCPSACTRSSSTQ